MTVPACRSIEDVDRFYATFVERGIGAPAKPFLRSVELHELLAVRPIDVELVSRAFLPLPPGRPSMKIQHVVTSIRIQRNDPCNSIDMVVERDAPDAFGQASLTSISIPRRVAVGLADQLWEAGVRPSKAPDAEAFAAIRAQMEREKAELRSANEKLRDIVDVLMP